ncbi:MAG TPA: restriction endonuclease [Ureibacillus sp.]|nr:restriction endonuclease [Ureibacillus sp.]
MNRHTSKIKQDRITQVLLLSILGFGLVITFLDLLSIEPNIMNGYFYLLLLIVLALLYRPMGIFLISKIIFVRKRINKSLKDWVARKVYKIDTKRIDQLNCVEVIQFLQPIFEKQNYLTQLTDESMDKKADLILKKGPKTYVVQANRVDHKVGSDLIHEVMERVKQCNANGAIIIINQYFTSSSKKLARKKNIKLIDRDELLKILRTNNNKKYRLATVFSLLIK